MPCSQLDDIPTTLVLTFISYDIFDSLAHRAREGTCGESQRLARFRIDLTFSCICTDTVRRRVGRDREAYYKYFDKDTQSLHRDGVGGYHRRLRIRLITVRSDSPALLCCSWLLSQLLLWEVPNDAKVVYTGDVRGSLFDSSMCWGLPFCYGYIALEPSNLFCSLLYGRVGGRRTLMGKVPKSIG